MPIIRKLTPSTRAELNDKIARLEEEKGYKVCGARTTNDDKPCPNKAGKGTDHQGIGRCWKHGGRNQSPSAGNYITGAKAQINYPKIKEKVEQLRQDSDVFDLRDHIFLVEALAETMLEQAREIEDLPPIVRTIDTLTKAVQRLHEIEVGRRYVISVENLGNVIGRVVEVIERHVPDPYLRSLIAQDILKIHNTPIPALDARMIEGQLVQS